MEGGKFDGGGKELDRGCGGGGDCIRETRFLFQRVVNIIRPGGLHHRGVFVRMEPDLRKYPRFYALSLAQRAGCGDDQL